MASPCTTFCRTQSGLLLLATAKCSSEKNAEYSDMQTPEMLGTDGNPRSGPQRLSAAQANARRAAAHSQVQESIHTPTPVPSDDDEMPEDQRRLVRRFQKKTSGREGGQDTVSIAG
jgi:hypothetical protein